jgi:hypothetical protein
LSASAESRGAIAIADTFKRIWRQAQLAEKTIFKSHFRSGGLSLSLSLFLTISRRSYNFQITSFFSGQAIANIVCQQSRTAFESARRLVQPDNIEAFVIIIVFATADGLTSRIVVIVGPRVRCLQGLAGFPGSKT